MAASAAWYEERRAELGRRFLAAVRATVRRVDASPRAGAPWSSPRSPIPVRRWRVAGFPFFVVYVADPEVVVVAVAHARRRPGFWRTRLPPTR